MSENLHLLPDGSESRADGILISRETLSLLRARVFGYLLSKGLRRPTAEDLTQDALLTLIDLVRKDPNRYSTEHLVPAAITVARNKLLNHWKKGSTRNETGKVLENEPLPDSVPDPEMEAQFSEVRTALKRLSSMCQEILHRKYFLRQTSREIAVGLGRSEQKAPFTENAVNIRTTRCLQDLRKSLMGTGRTTLPGEGS
jgi:RNA polymerase sigma factor (sigma-70 family)